VCAREGVLYEGWECAAWVGVPEGVFERAECVYGERFLEFVREGGSI
jgi:hypothetical protein